MLKKKVNSLGCCRDRERYERTVMVEVDSRGRDTKTTYDNKSQSGDKNRQSGDMNRYSGDMNRYSGDMNRQNVVT